MTQDPTAMPQLDYTVTLPGGEQVTGHHPLVVIGPNGSGKTRQTRGIGASVGIEFINALRNTRVAAPREMDSVLADRSPRQRSSGRPDGPPTRPQSPHRPS